MRGVPLIRFKGVRGWPSKWFDRFDLRGLGGEGCEWFSGFDSRGQFLELRVGGEGA
jgi:hypothetical protein